MASESVPKVVGYSVRSEREFNSGHYSNHSAGQVSEVLDEGMSRVITALLDLRAYLRHFAGEYPVQMIAVSVGLAFVAGMSLRIWRSNRHESY